MVLLRNEVVVKRLEQQIDAFRQNSFDQYKLDFARGPRWILPMSTGD